MNEQNKKVPTIRFKGFTDDWEQRKLSKLTTEIGTGKSKYKLQDNGRYPILGSTSVIGYDNNFDYTGDFILTARVGANAGNLYRFAGSVKITDNTVFIKSKYNKFLYYYLQKYDLKKLSFGTGQPLVKASELKNLKILKPRLDEEIYRISKLLLSVDNLITLHQRKLVLLKQLKKGLLQKMFAEKNSKQPNLRFKNFNGDWEQRKLGELIESLFQGINTAADKVEYSNNGLPIIQAKNITSGSLDFSGSRKLSVQKYSNYLDKYIPQKGDILFANIGTIGPNVILKDTRQFFIAWNILRIVPQKNINGEFLKITLDLLNSKHYFEKLLTGNATKFVNKNDMRNLPIFFSDPEEQNKISNLFKKLDFLITLQQQKLAKYQSIKKSLLQQMFI